MNILNEIEVLTIWCGGSHVPSCCRCSWSCSSCCWSVATCGRCIQLGNRLQLRAMGRGLGIGIGTLGPAFFIGDESVHFPLSYNICICTGSFIKEARPANTCEMSADEMSLSTRLGMVEISCPLHRLYHTVGTIPLNPFFWYPKEAPNKMLVRNFYPIY